MNPPSRYVAALVTAPDIDTARALARAALEARFCACAQVIPGLESHYWWQGKLETSQEVLVLFKTVRPLVESLQALVLKQHPYDTAQFVVVDLTGGSPKYLEWLESSVKERVSELCSDPTTRL